jgi:very-short-patch-repair endonuclease
MDWLGKQSLDFFLSDCKVGIECQGSQHFIEDKFMKELEIIKSRDLKKKQLCKENGVKLIYFLDKRFNKYMKENDIYFNDVDELVKYIKDYKN